MKLSKTTVKDLPISTKKTVEICNFIRGKELNKAKSIINEVLEKKLAVPFKRYNMGVGHRRGKIGSGKYPTKACKEVLKLLKLAEANAKNLNLSINDLYIKSIIPNMGSRPWHYGRLRRRKMKRTSIEIILSEKERSK